MANACRPASLHCHHPTVLSSSFQLSAPAPRSARCYVRHMAGVNEWTRRHPRLEGLVAGGLFALTWTVAVVVAGHKQLDTTLPVGLAIGVVWALLTWATSSSRHDPDRPRPHWYLWVVVAIGLGFLAAMGYGRWRVGS